jgi:hypothetical protein
MFPRDHRQSLVLELRGYSCQRLVSHLLRDNQGSWVAEEGEGEGEIAEGVGGRKEGRERERILCSYTVC